MDDEKVLEALICEVGQLKDAVKGLQTYVAQNVAPKNNTVYPYGYVPYNKMIEECEQPILSEIADDFIHAGLVAGGCPNDQHPIIPMIFHRNYGPMYASAIVDGKVKFAPFGPHAMPIIIGNEDEARGVYMPFDTPEEGIKAVEAICDIIRYSKEETNLKELM